MHTLFSGKGKCSCQLTDCCLLAQLDCTSPECNFLSTGFKKTVYNDNIRSHLFLHQNKILCIIKYAQMCVIRKTGYCFKIHAFDVNESMHTKNMNIAYLQQSHINNTNWPHLVTKENKLFQKY